jgi:hypothetical protein
MLQKKGRRSITRYLHTKAEKIRLQLLADSAVAILQILLNLGANPNRPGGLLIAARTGLVKGMDLLLKKGADLRSTFDGGSLLFEAREGGVRRQAIKLLRRYGWDVEKIRKFERPTEEPNPMSTEFFG